MYVEPRKMVQMSRFAGQKLRHRCREQTYGHQGGKTAVGGMNWGKKKSGDYSEPKRNLGVNKLITTFRTNEERQ